MVDIAILLTSNKMIPGSEFRAIPVFILFVCALLFQGEVFAKCHRTHPFYQGADGSLEQFDLREENKR